MPSRDFDAARAERLRQRDPITFVLGGHTFTCLPTIPLGAGLDLADAPEFLPSNVMSAKALVAFVDNVLVDDDRPKFHEVLRDREHLVDATTVYELVVWLGGEYAGRPTSPSTDSSGGRDTSGDTSNVEPAEKALVS